MIEAVLAALFGLLIGSFLNVCIYRLPRDLSVVRPRSFCPTCEKQIAWFDNVPLLSYAVLGGACRHCRAPIGWRYPAVEVLTSGFFFVITLTLGPTLAALKLCVFSALIIGLIFADLEERILPDEFTLGGTLVGFVFAYLVPLGGGLAYLLFPMEWGNRWLSVGESVLGAGFNSVAIWSVGALYEKIRHREGLGFGDVKMVALIGSFLGMHLALMTLIVGSLLGSLIGLAFILISRKDASTYELPFGSFLGAAALLVAVFGEQISLWYMKLMGS
jgi:leader peptidase (prepilin peptidase)/N-methyltransferase